jgi:hypothetical protein
MNGMIQRVGLTALVVVIVVLVLTGIAGASGYTDGPMGVVGHWGRMWMNGVGHMMGYPNWMGDDCGRGGGMMRGTPGPGGSNNCGQGVTGNGAQGGTGGPGMMGR